MNAPSIVADRTLPPAPRTIVRMRGVAPELKAFGFLLLPHVWVGIAIVAVPIFGAVREAVGHVSTATVIDREITTGKGTHHRVEYQYQESGATYTDKDNVTASRWEELRIGSKLRVRSLHVLGIGNAKIEDTPSWGPGVCCIIPFAILWNGALLSMFWPFVIDAGRNRWLAIHGNVTNGQVINKSLAKDKRGIYGVVTFSYLTPVGQGGSGQAELTEELFNSLKMGQAIRVFTSPRYPWKTLIYEVCEFRVPREE